MRPELQRRIFRAAFLLDRVDAWFKLAYMEKEEADSILRDLNQEGDEAEDSTGACEGDSTGTGSYPAGPRSEKNKSRYQLSPGHSQHLSDLLRSTAETRANEALSRLLNE